jgi:hypothetical protein
MERVLIAAGLVAVAVVVAFVLRRRPTEAPTQPKRWPVPSQLDRADFEGPERPWLVAVFTSSTCDTCAGAIERALPLASPQVVVQEVPWQRAKLLHDRYAVEAVPCTVVADADGVVQAGFVGQVSAQDLWAAVAAARDNPNPA